MQKLIGTLLSSFRIGRTGPRLVDNSGNLEVKNKDGNALVKVRAADAVGSTDVTPKGQVDTMFATRDARLDGHDTDIANVQSGLSTAQTSLSNVETDLGTAQTDIANLQSDLFTAQASLATAQASFTTAQASLATAQSDLAIAQADIATLGAEGVDRTLAITLGTNATYEAASQLPAGCVVKEVKLRVTTAYDAGTEIQVGSAGVPGALMGAADNDPTLAELQEVELWASVPMAFTPRVSIAGSPSAGAATVAITYTTPQG